MRLLAIETATEACSVALAVDGQILQRFEVAPREHAALILSFCDQVLAEAEVNKSQLDAIAFGRGPGSFTGVRIAVGVAQGMGFALDRPLVPISTLAALAQGAARAHGWSRVLAAIDARMGEVYGAAFEIGPDGLMQPVTPESVSAPEAVRTPEGAWYGAGTGWGSYGARISGAATVLAQDGAALPQACDTALLAQAAVRRGEGVAAEEALPVYLRDKVAHRKQG